MKFRILALLLFICGVLQAQNFPPIYGKIRYVDSLQFSKYKNNLAGDSVLTTDTSGKLKMKLVSGGGSGNYLDSFWRVSGIDSNYYRINGVNYAVLDSTAAGFSGVTAVTASPPLYSSGGTSPDLSADTSKAAGKLATYSDIQGRSDTSTVINSGEINWPGALYSTPTTASIAGHKITFAPALASQTSKYVFTNPSGSSGVPSFNLLDSSWLAGMHTQGYYDGRYAAAGGSGWSLTGNAGIDSATQYLGTSDAKPFQIKTAATNRMIFTQDGKNSLISGANTNDGVFYNVIAGSVQMTGRLFLKLNKGASNIAIGQTSLNSMNTGVDNIGMGYDAGYSITNGTGNVAIGRSALLFLAGTRNYNVGIGYNVGYSQTSGDYNIVIGTGSNLPNATGSGQLNIGNAIFGTGINQTFAANSTPAGAISIGINAPAASALLDLTSTGKGFLQPRMTTTQMNAISSPAIGLEIFNTTDSTKSQYRGTGSGWQPVTYHAQSGIGQTTLSSGTIDLSISSVKSTSLAFITLVTPSGTTLTTSYQAVCTAGHLVIQANVAAGTINTADGSTLNYMVVEK